MLPLALRSSALGARSCLRIQTGGATTLLHVTLDWQSRVGPFRILGRKRQARIACESEWRLSRIFDACFCAAILAAHRTMIAASIALLAFLPAYPRNRIILALWIACLILAAAHYIWAAFFAPPLLWEMRWKIPAWHGPIFIISYVAIPFSTSFVLWRIRRNSSGLSATATTIIMVMICLALWFAVTTLNRTCVFSDVFHGGDARVWCP